MKKNEKEYLQSRLRALPENDKRQYGYYLVKSWLKEYRSVHATSSSPLVVPEQTSLALPKTNGHDKKKPYRHQYRHPGPKLEIPSDKSVITEVREAMRAFPHDQNAASLSISMGKYNYKVISRLIALSDKPFVSHADREAIQRCFDIIERERQIKPVREIVEDIIGRNWVSKRDRPYVISQRRRRFDQTVMSISESCESTTEMALPSDMSKDDVAKIVGSLARSVERVSRLIQRLVGEAEEK